MGLGLGFGTRVGARVKVGVRVRVGLADGHAELSLLALLEEPARLVGVRVKGQA